MKKSTQRVIVIALAAVMLLSVLLPALSMLSGATSATKSKIDELKSQISSNASQIKSIEEKLETAQSEEAAAKEQKALLEEKIGVLNEQISNTEVVIEEYAELIDEKETEIAALEQKEASQYELFCSQVRDMEEHGSVTYWSILFSSSSFTELLENIMLVSEVMEYNNGVIDALVATQEEEETAKGELEEAKSEQEAVKAQQEANKQELQSEQAKSEALIAQIQEQESSYQSDLDQYEQESTELDQELAEAESQYAAELAEIERKKAEEEAKKKAAAAAAAAAAASSSSSSSSSGTTTSSYNAAATSGDWYWPLPGRYYISSVFGGRVHPITGKYSNHSGNDIPAPSGTPIHAANDGVVTKVGTNSVYGNYIQISHGNGYSTFYGHMKTTAIVAQGSTVTKGQVIGYVGTTGWSTGNHLHYELYINGVKSDSLSLYPGLTFTY